MEKKFQELNQAYEVLGDEGNRKKYDQYGPNWKEAEAYERARQQAGGAYPGGQPHSGFTQGGGEDFSAIFENMFGRGAQREGSSFRNFAMAGADLEADLPISLREAFTGTRRTVTLPDATGTPRPIEVRIPAGVRNGERLRVKGKGSPGRGGGPPGNLFFHVHIASHPVFHRKKCRYSCDPSIVAMGSRLRNRGPSTNLIRASSSQNSPRQSTSSTHAVKGERASSTSRRAWRSNLSC